MTGVRQAVADLGEGFGDGRLQGVTATWLIRGDAAHEMCASLYRR